MIFLSKKLESALLRIEKLEENVVRLINERNCANNNHNWFLRKREPLEYILRDYPYIACKHCGIEKKSPIPNATPINIARPNEANIATK